MFFILPAIAVKINTMKRLNEDTISLSVIFLLALFSADHVYAQLAEDKCRFLGNIISNSVPTDFSVYWNQVTPENGGKWGSVESTKNVMVWNDLDVAYNYATTNNLPFKQHTFVWGQQQPGWISSLSLEDQKKEVDEWIRLFCERYPSTD